MRLFNYLRIIGPTDHEYFQGDLEEVSISCKTQAYINVGIFYIREPAENEINITI